MIEVSGPDSESSSRHRKAALAQRLQVPRWVGQVSERRRRAMRSSPRPAVSSISEMPIMALELAPVKAMVVGEVTVMMAVSVLSSRVAVSSSSAEETVAVLVRLPLVARTSAV